MFSGLRLILKARKAFPVGTIRTRKDGRRYRKVAPDKWVFVSAANRERMDKEFYDEKSKEHLNEAYRLFTESTGKMSWAGIGIVEHLEDEYSIYDFDDLKEYIKDSPSDRASALFRSTKNYIDSLSIPVSMKQAAVDRFGRAVLALKNAHAGPKEKLMVKVEKPSGEVKYRYKEDEPITAFPPTTVKRAKMQLGGWTDMSKIPTSSQLDKMLDIGSAEVVKGKPDDRRNWEVRQSANDVEIPFREEAEGIKVHLRQSKKVKKRTKTTAEVEMVIPYPYAERFLKKQIDSKRTRNALIGELRRSKGFKRAAGFVEKRPEPAEEADVSQLPGPAERLA